jgi:hypothetical protein
MDRRDEADQAFRAVAAALGSQFVSDAVTLLRLACDKTRAARASRTSIPRQGLARRGGTDESAASALQDAVSAPADGDRILPRSRDSARLASSVQAAVI